MITTKKGSNRKGIGISVNSGITFSKINEATMPKHQKLYGAGYGQYYEDASGYFFEADVDGDGILDLIVPTSEDASFGAKFDPNLMVVHWDALDPTSPNYGEKRPWVAGANGIETFFETGVSVINNISLDGGDDNNTFRLSFTNRDETGTEARDDAARGVQSQVLNRTVLLFEVVAERVEEKEIADEVEHVRVEKHRGHETVELAVLHRGRNQPKTRHELVRLLSRTLQLDSQNLGFGLIICPIECP